MATSKIVPASFKAKQMRSHQQVISYDSEEESAHNSEKRERARKAREEEKERIQELHNKIETASDSLKEKIDNDISKVV